VAASVLRRGLLLALAGVLVAVALYFANPWIGFPSWALFLWPTSVLMMGLSGVQEPEATRWVIGIIASNGLLYFVVGMAVMFPVNFTCRGLAHLRHRRPGK
jgi:hypothetical protein